jgi:predicted SAM-dependent methyltransferase
MDKYQLQEIQVGLDRSKSRLEQIKAELSSVQDKQPPAGDRVCPARKLHIGCGTVKMDGWINIDANIRPGVTDLQLDITKGLPYEDNSCSLIYHEHVLEHLPVEAAVNFLQECYRVLQTGGTMRIAMPSLEFVIEKYSSEDWRSGQDWLTWPEYQFIQTRAEMLNIALRWWGHQYLYDREELHRRLREAGFEKIKDVEWGISDLSELLNRETRKDSLLICEVQK